MADKEVTKEAPTTPPDGAAAGPTANEPGPKASGSFESLVGGPVAQPTNQPTKPPADGGPDLMGLGFTPAGKEGPTLGITREQHDAAIASAAANLAPEHEQGWKGFNPDPNPNDSYTVAGVTAAAQVPVQPIWDTPEQPDDGSEESPQGE